MLRPSKFPTVCLLAVLSIAAPTLLASAQLSAPQLDSQLAPQTSVAEALRNLASRSGVVFAGQVLSIERKGDVVEIAFRVDQPVQVAVGSSYTLREWGGLWPPGQHRYIVGQRLLIFLHPTAAAGLSSPVDGMDGIVPLVSAAATGSPLLDVRRLAANLQRAVGQPLPGDAAAAISLADAAEIVTHWRQPVRREPVRRPLPLPLPLPEPITGPQPILFPVSPGRVLQEGTGATDARP